MVQSFLQGTWNKKIAAGTMPSAVKLQQQHCHLLSDWQQALTI